jgi:hypothetical protein
MRGRAESRGLGGEARLGTCHLRPLVARPQAGFKTVAGQPGITYP